MSGGELRTPCLIEINEIVVGMGMRELNVSVRITIKSNFFAVFVHSILL